MKGQFQNVQQLGHYITEKERTAAPNDEMNITQANSVAKELIRVVGGVGGQTAVTVFRRKLENEELLVGKAELTMGQLERLVKIIEDLFEWEWRLFFPWTKARRNSKNLAALCRQYGYLDNH